MSLKAFFCGDIFTGGKIEAQCQRENNNVFESFEPLIKECDLSIFNLESPLTQSKFPIRKTGPSLKSSPRTIEALRLFTHASLSNNHIRDYGEKGILDTVGTLTSANIESIGIGDGSIENYISRPIVTSETSLSIVSACEQEFSIGNSTRLGACHANPLIMPKVLQHAKERAEHVVCYLHAGIEYYQLPSPRLRQLAEFCIDLGASAVVCHHSHVPGAYQVYKGKPIFFSLGNTLFYSERPKHLWNTGYSVVLEFKSGSVEVQKIIPHTQRSCSRVQPLEGHELEGFNRMIQSVNNRLDCPLMFKESWQDHINRKQSEYLIRYLLPSNMRGKEILSRISPRFTNFLYRGSSRELDKLNIIQCESHLETLLAVLSSRLK